MERLDTQILGKDEALRGAVVQQFTGLKESLAPLVEEFTREISFED